MEESREFYSLVAKRAEQHGKQRLEPELHRAWEEARQSYPNVRYSPEYVALKYFMHYAAAYVHPDEAVNVTLSRWLAKP